MYENKGAESAEHDLVKVCKVYNSKRPENMLQPDSPFYLAVNYCKTEAQSKSENSKWSREMV